MMMVHFAMIAMMSQVVAPEQHNGHGTVAFHEDPFGAGFAGDAVYFVSNTPAGEEMTVLMADIPNLCDAIRTRHGDQDVRVWVAEVTERGGEALQVNTGTHIVMTDDALYDDSFEHKGGVAMLAYIHKRAGGNHAPAFVGMAARGHIHIAGFDRHGGDVEGDFRATFQLGYNKGRGGYLQAASSGRFQASHCPEGAVWQQALLGA